MPDQTAASSGEDMTMPSVESRPKPRSKAKSKSASEGRAKKSLNLSLPFEDVERLAVHALRAGSTMSELVSKLVREHCRDYHITRTPGGSKSD